ncbi:MAG: hypothetical protein C0616_01590 [Desulfuromonas sp.]|nr:MAG: hypothetical protein C0616_01590 [Desulfuromonas sp.]
MHPELRQPATQDWDHFFRLAVTEGWCIPSTEQEMFGDQWRDHARVTALDGTFAGMVTAVPHETSGWIGNLIIPSELRRQGLGTQLFTAACAALEQHGCQSIWLTASTQGQPLYASFGFRVVDHIHRWIHPGREGHRSKKKSERNNGERLAELDRQAWGEKRNVMLNGLMNHGEVLVTEDAVALLQRGPDFQVIGPWYSPNLCPRSNRLLLQEALDEHPAPSFVADLLASSPVAQLLAAAGFRKAGENALMVRGTDAAVNRSMMVSLASLGSFG